MKKLKFFQKIPSWMKNEALNMFNNVNNPFGNREISSSTSSDSNGRRQKEDPKEELKKYIDEEEPDEVLIGGQPILTEEEVLSMTRQYISKLKSEHENNEKIQKKLDKYLDNFDVKKFMKKNPNMTSPDFYMVMFNETEGLVK